MTKVTQDPKRSVSSFLKTVQTKFPVSWCLWCREISANSQKWIPTFKHKSENIHTEFKNKSENSEPNLLKNPFKILTTQFVQLPEKIKLVEETVIFPPTARKQLEGFEGGRVTSFDQSDSRRKVDPHGQFLEGFGEPVSTVFSSCPVC